MTKEENKAIEDIRKTNGDILREIDNLRICLAKGVEKREIIIKALREKVENLQKENEDLNNREISRLSEIGELRTKNNYLENEIKYYYIQKDKIEEIKNINIGQYKNFYREIEELLEEG